MTGDVDVGVARDADQHAPAAAAVQEHDRVGALADVAAGRQLASPARVRPCAAVGADDQPVRARRPSRRSPREGVDPVQGGVDADAEPDDEQQQHEQHGAQAATPAAGAPWPPRGRRGGRAATGRSTGGRSGTRGGGGRGGHHRRRLRPAWRGGPAPRRRGRVGPDGQTGGGGAGGRCCCGPGRPGRRHGPAGPRGPPRSSPPMLRTTLRSVVHPDEHCPSICTIRSRARWTPGWQHPSVPPEGQVRRTTRRRSASSRGRLRATRWPPGISSTARPSRSRATRRWNSSGNRRSSRPASTRVGTSGQRSAATAA